MQGGRKIIRHGRQQGRKVVIEDNLAIGPIPNAPLTTQFHEPHKFTQGPDMPFGAMQIRIVLIVKDGILGNQRLQGPSSSRPFGAAIEQVRQGFDRKGRLGAFVLQFGFHLNK